MLRSNIEAALWAGLLIVNEIILLVLWLANSGRLLAGDVFDVSIALGRVTGLFLGYLVLIELLLISRAPSFEHAFGFDTLNRTHRVTGFVMLGLLVAHPVFLSIGYAGGENPVAQFFAFAQWEGVFAATIGAIAMLGAGIASIKIIRKRMSYDAWYLLHLLMYIGAMLAFWHTIESGDVARGGALAYWLALSAFTALTVIGYRFGRPLYRFFTNDFRIEKVVRESPSTHSIYITGNNMDTFRFEEGQFANFIFLKKGMCRHHPFSFSKVCDGTGLRITVKNLGDFTSRISTLVPGTRVIIDGPLGRFTRTAAETKKYCFIGGGVGVTPVVALAGACVRDGIDAVLIASFRTPEDTPLAEDIRTLGLPAHIIFSDGEGGRFVDGAFVASLCPDILERDVFVCGPVPMMDALEKGLLDIGVLRNRIHTERFAF
ncbi:MAG: hypothetical protein HGA67_01840 [Candidatus Yonathbacteria bacterium]|nr:hypothetical protein [Candidatus Yonathbacteria bacterium]